MLPNIYKILTIIGKSKEKIGLMFGEITKQSTKIFNGILQSL